MSIFAQVRIPLLLLTRPQMSSEVVKPPEWSPRYPTVLIWTKVQAKVVPSTAVSASFVSCEVSAEEELHAAHIALETANVFTVNVVTVVCQLLVGHLARRLDTSIFLESKS